MCVFPPFGLPISIHRFTHCMPLCSCDPDPSWRIWQVISSHLQPCILCVYGRWPWEQIRFHHEALVSLVCLHSQLSSMLLGLILVGNVVNLCFALYYFFAVQAGVLGVLTCTKGIVVLLTIIASSSILEKEVRKNFIKHDEKIALIIQTMSWIFPKNIYMYRYLLKFLFPNENWFIGSEDGLVLKRR